jgi:hypothetical protein
MTSRTPKALDLPSLMEGRPIMASPQMPPRSAQRWLMPGSRLSRIVATMAAKMGIPPLSMPASEEEMCCWAMGNNVIGKANHVTATANNCGQALRGILVFRADGTKANVRNPNNMRPKVTAAGVNPSRDSAICRNDAPQINPGTARRIQSLRVKASRLVPSAVSTRLASGVSAWAIGVAVPRSSVELGDMRPTSLPALLAFHWRISDSKACAFERIERFASTVWHGRRRAIQNLAVSDAQSLRAGV